MTFRKTFQINEVNNENVKSLQQVAKADGITVRQSSIINLAIELFFRDKQDNLQDLIEQLKIEHII